MPEVDLDKLRHHVQFVRDTVRRIEEIRARGKEAFLGDRILQDATVHQLQIGIEALVDIANHVIAREGFGVPRAALVP